MQGKGRAPVQSTMAAFVKRRKPPQSSGDPDLEAAIAASLAEPGPSQAQSNGGAVGMRAAAPGVAPPDPEALIEEDSREAGLSQVTLLTLSGRPA